MTFSPPMPLASSVRDAVRRSLALGAFTLGCGGAITPSEPECSAPSCTETAKSNAGGAASGTIQGSTSNPSWGGSGGVSGIQLATGGANSAATAATIVDQASPMLALEELSGVTITFAPKAGSASDETAAETLHYPAVPPTRAYYRQDGCGGTLAIRIVSCDALVAGCVLFNIPRDAPPYATFVASDGTMHGFTGELSLIRAPMVNATDSGLNTLVGSFTFSDVDDPTITLSGEISLPISPPGSSQYGVLIIC